jgi:hypothetical protein
LAELAMMAGQVADLPVDERRWVANRILLTHTTDAVFKSKAYKRDLANRKIIDHMLSVGFQFRCREEFACCENIKTFNSRYIKEVTNTTEAQRNT